MNKPIQISSFDNSDTLAQQLAGKVAKQLSQAIANRDKAMLVVSGGSTPMQFFDQLSKRSIDWSKVSVTLADERWVEPSHSDSNEKLVREKLLINEAAKATFISLKNAAETADEGCSQINAYFAEVGKFDVVILGMGGDGHTASLFPKTDKLLEGLDMHSDQHCIAITPLDTPHERISMTLPRLLDCDNLYLHIGGENKMQVLKQAQSDISEFELPIRAILLQQEVPVSVFWSP